MKRILVTDVFGITTDLLELGNQLETKVIDPYNGDALSFVDEAQAYSYFMKHVGIDNYLSILQKEISSIESDISLIGFSVGATVIWRLSANKIYNHIKQAYCFYGSQIRHYSDLDPLFKVNLIFPQKEAHFDVGNLNIKLNKKENVMSKQVDFLHGFMNHQSNNFNLQAYESHLNSLKKKLDSH